MAIVTDFKKLRNKRRRKKVLKASFIIILLMAATFIFSAISKQPNFVDVDSLFNLFKGGPGYPIEAPGGKSKGMYQNAGNLIFINETNLYLYNSSGSEISDIQHRMVNPQVITKGNMALNFDRGSKSYAVYHRSSVALSNKSDYAIKAGDISAKGDIILATQSDTSQSTVIVMDLQEREKFRWKTASNVTNVAISNNGSNVAVASVYVEQGVLKTKLNFLKDGKQTGEKILDDQMIFKMAYNENNQLHIITEKYALSCDSTGKIIGQYDFHNQQLSGFALHEKGAVLIFGDYEQARKYTMVSLAADMITVNGSTVLSDSLQKVKVQGNTILILGSSTLNQYSTLDCALLDTKTADTIYDIQPMGKFIYALTNTQIMRIDLKEQSGFVNFGASNNALT